MHQTISMFSEERWLIDVLSFYGNIDPRSVVDRYPGNILQTLSTQLKISSITITEKIARVIVGAILQKVSADSRTKITSLLKKVRNKNKQFTILYPRDFTANQIVSTMVKESGFTWNGRQSAICITHDVDNATGYDYLPHLISINRKFGIASTVNFLTHDEYRVEPGLLLQLQAESNEIGLHGYTHDIGFAYRKTDVIHNLLTSSMNSLGIPLAGYRGPALCTSQKLLATIDKLGFRYDSSMQVLSPFYRSLGLNYPYPLPGTHLWELPLAIQDDYFFRDFNVNNIDALTIIKQILTDIHELGGVAVLGFHPHIMADKSYFYHEILEMICKFNNAWVTTTGELCSFVSGEYNKHL